jgi:hypothetical protein
LSQHCFESVCPSSHVGTDSRGTASGRSRQAALRASPVSKAPALLGTQDRSAAIGGSVINVATMIVIKTRCVFLSQCDIEHRPFICGFYFAAQGHSVTCPVKR